jgi:hypothetical protein
LIWIFAQLLQHRFDASIKASFEIFLALILLYRLFIELESADSRMLEATK